MSISLGLNGAQPVNRADIQRMDVHAALLTVNFVSMENFGNALKDQVADIQERNIQMSDTRETMSLARTLLAQFGADAQNDAAIPEGPERQAFQTAAAALGFDTSGIANKGQLTAAIDTLKSRIDGLGSTQQMAMLRMQSWMNGLNEATTSATNQLKSDHDSKTSIVNNMRG